MSARGVLLLRGYLRHGGQSERLLATQELDLPMQSDCRTLPLSPKHSKSRVVFTTGGAVQKWMVGKMEFETTIMARSGTCEIKEELSWAVGGSPVEWDGNDDDVG